MIDHGGKTMNCPHCGNLVAERRNRCEVCGKDLATYKKVYRISNLYYNRGLEKAMVRDLSGAVLMLKKSLEMNKRNTNARNLLGLVLYEMGETVAALSEWVISKHFQSKENDADVYMGLLQENPTKLDNLNQAIKKYNIALESAKQGSDDLAIIQLKKVVNLNPHFIRALQLLALIYMKNNEYERARRCLLKASKIDISNTTTLRYLTELNSLISGGTSGQVPYWSDGDGKNIKDIKTHAITPISGYKEDKPNIMAYVNLVIGIIIGIAVVFILIVPTVKKNVIDQYAKEQVNYSSELNVQLAKISSKDKEIESLTKDLEEANAKLKTAEATTYDEKMYDNLFKALTTFIAIDDLEKASNEELLKVADAIAAIKPDNMNNTEAVAIYNIMKDAIYPMADDIAYQVGREYYDDGKFEDAIKTFLKAYKYNSVNDSVLYYLGKSYQETDNKEKAIKYFNELVKNCPDSDLKGYAQSRIDSLQ